MNGKGKKYICRWESAIAALWKLIWKSEHRTINSKNWNRLEKQKNEIETKNERYSIYSQSITKCANQTIPLSSSKQKHQHHQQLNNNFSPEKLKLLIIIQNAHILYAIISLLEIHSLFVQPSDHVYVHHEYLIIKS